MSEAEKLFRKLVGHWTDNIEVNYTMRITIDQSDLCVFSGVLAELDRLRDETSEMETYIRGLGCWPMFKSWQEYTRERRKAVGTQPA